MSKEQLQAYGHLLTWGCGDLNRPEKHYRMPKNVSVDQTHSNHSENTDVHNTRIYETVIIPKILNILLKWLKIFFDKRDLSFMSPSTIISRFKIHWFPNETDINLATLMPDEDKTF